jgi:hypothetical protein
MLYLVFAGFLLAHGLIHATYLAPAPVAAEGAPVWPFHLDRSWLLSRLHVRASAAQATGNAFVLTVVVAFVLAAIGVAFVLPWWPTAVAVAAALSLVQLTVWFDRWLALGLVIDASLLATLLLAAP